LDRIYAVLRRRIVLFALIVLSCTVLAVLVGLMTPLQYSASARIVIDPREQKVLPDAQMLASLTADPATIDSQVEILKSRALVEQVVRRFALTADPEFNVAPRGGRGLRGLFLPTARSAPQDARTELVERVVDAVSARLSVANMGLSSVIQITFKSRSSIKAARIANAFAQTYIEDQRLQKVGANTRASGWLLSRLTELRENSERSDAALKRYEVDRGIVGLQSATGATANQQEIQSLTSELATARGAEAEAIAKLNAARRARSGDSAESMNSPVLQAYKQQRAEASAKLAQLTTRYGARYPEVQTVQREIADIDRQMTGELGSVMGALETDVSAARSRTAQVAAALARANEALKRASLASVGANALSKRADADKAVYEAFLNRYKLTSAQSGMENADARIISLATPQSRPTSPSLKLLALIGLLMGGASGIVATALADAMLGGVYNEDQLEDDLALSPLGTIVELPRARSPRADGVAVIDQLGREPESVFAEMVRSVAGNILSTVSPDTRIIMITSALADGGKSTSALLIARAIAGMGRKTLFIDGDAVKRSATRQLGEAIPAGIVELIDGTAPMSSVIMRDRDGPLEWIGVRDHARRTGVFAQAPAAGVLEELRKRYDVIVIDAAPLLATADARALATHADEVVLAVRWLKTPRRAVRATLKALAGLGITPAGAVLTRVDLRRQARMGDGSRYSYGAQYISYTRSAQ
jgi:uncharacterized protein involved in exopolysaccharide biosynthesis/Mrp family chromosome partitioning ATPase